jgi:hypothetical protein
VHFISTAVCHEEFEQSLSALKLAFAWLVAESDYYQVNS